MFRFIIKYNSLRDFGPEVLGLFLYEEFWKMIFWLMLKLEINYRIIISWKILVSFRGFFEDYIFAWWIIWILIIHLFPYDICKWQGHNVTHPLFFEKKWQTLFKKPLIKSFPTSVQALEKKHSPSYALIIYMVCLVYDKFSLYFTMGENPCIQTFSKCGMKLYDYLHPRPLTLKMHTPLQLYPYS